MEHYTRADYMEHRVEHHTYYLAIAKAAGISFAQSSKLAEIRAALAKGDEHLNTIPLAWWDGQAAFVGPAIARAVKAFPGEGCSLAVCVCALKAAARDAASEGCDAQPS